MKIYPIMIKDQGKKTRAWWCGDAAHQNATENCLPSESVYPVGIEEEGLRSSSIKRGWAVGK